MKKLIAALLCGILLLCSCQRQAPGKGKVIRYDLPAPISTLDPQFATDAYSRMIISNIYEGLVTRGENGELVPGVAESYEVSADKKTLYFKLKGDARWNGGEPVTAHDFVFAFRRMFASDSPSAFAKDYIAIEGAEKVMEGTASPEMLGVFAKSDYELEITLEHPSPFFPALLAETPAMPCSREAFEKTRGRYGLERQLVSSNGPFYLDRWDNEATIRLLPNPDYLSETTAPSGGVYLRVAPEESPLERLLSGASDIAKISFDDAEKIKTEGYASDGFQDTVWCIVFNLSSEVWGNPLLRQGLARTINQDLLRESLPDKLTTTTLLVPPTSVLADAMYRGVANASPTGFEPEEGRRLFEMGMSALSIDNFTNAAFYVPNSLEHTLAMSAVQQSWQRYLSAYMNVTPMPLEDIEKRFHSGDYDILLVPLTSETPSAVDFLSRFQSASSGNFLGYKNGLFDSALAGVARAESLQEAGAACARAESMLLQDAVLIPVYFETSVFASAPGLKGVNATPYPASLNFKFAER